MADRKILLSESDLPRQWYNVQADLPKPMAPPLHPGTRQPIDPEALAPIFPMELIKQEVTSERWIEVPDPVREAYMIWRPSPLRRAIDLEKFLKTPARIYYKDESVSPAGSHKPNTAVPQAYYNKQAGVKRLSTETGAGQWGSALAFAANIFGLECKVYMVKASYDQKPYRRLLMEVWGASVVPSPSRDTEAGRKFLAEDADTPGSLGMAISEAVEDAAKRDDTKYALGSVLNHVLLHQTVIGLEAEKQLKLVDEKQPDVVIGCVGGGSNFAGIAFPFMPMKFKGKDIKFLAVEPLACPTVSRGMFRYDFGDTAQMTPLLKMFTLGHTFVPAGIHAGGLRYHGMAPLVSHLCALGAIEPRAYHQNPVFDAAVTFARTEGMVCAPETAHAIRCVIDEAIRCREEKKEACILFNYSGHGFFDLAAYDKYFSKDLEDYEYPAEKIAEAMKHIPVVE
ncbi:MAG TPA: TrpB-like pyridoxal phosphate-dependent enzyme [Candidatus Methylomirabilis sp.]